MSRVDYEYYIGVYSGGVFKDASAFASALTEAEAYIDNLTRGKATEDTPAVKNAICAVAEVIHKQAHDEESAISSESVGNHSRTYTSSKKTDAEREQEKYRKAAIYLSRTGLLFRGLT